MTRNSATRVVISKKAYHQIRDSVTNAKNEFEVGGLLLGYKLLHRYSIVAVTVPAETEEKSQVSFTLNGDWHTSRALELMQAFQCKPSILGIWHSHICDGHKFSKQDILSNKILAEILGGALSMLVTKSTHIIAFSTSHISTTGTAEDCVVKVQAKAERRNDYGTTIQAVRIFYRKRYQRGSTI